jgi:hypothetical protein
MKIRTLTRALLITNFVQLLLLIGPGNSRTLYSAEKRLGIADFIDYASNVWTISSTILAVVLFIWISVSRSEACRAQRPKILDWALLLGWFFAVAIVCLFGFIAGLGG